MSRKIPFKTSFPPNSAHDPRRLAWEILRRVSSGRQTLDYWLEAAAASFERLNAADRALAHALIYGTLRWQSRLDHVIDRLAAKPHRIDPKTRILLRLAMFQLHYLDRIPPSAAVDTAVDLAKQIGRTWDAGFVNGVLRRAAASARNVDRAALEDDQALAVAVRCSLPPWLAERWAARFGLPEMLSLCQAVNSVPSITLRTNTLRTSRPELIACLQGEAADISPTRCTPEGIVVAGVQKPLHQWSSFRNGWFQVQDEAAQLVSHLLSPLPGQTVWDACAGMGTKTGHLAQLMKNSGTLVASDRQADKLERLRHEMQRLGATIVKPQLLDLTAPEPLQELPLFDRILLDAPCSGLGVLRKNPDGKWRVQAQDLALYHQRQVAFLERTAHYLRSGGLLVYAVCSFEPEENEHVVEAFLQKHSEFAISPPSIDCEAAVGHLLTPERWLKTYPHRHAMDGFFAAALVKKP